MVPSQRAVFVYRFGAGALACASVLALLGFVPRTIAAADGWIHLSSSRGEIPVPPGGSKQQTAAVVGDFTGDGVNDFILAFRQKPPALVLYQRETGGWTQRILDDDYLTIEAGGATADIDRDGDLDVVLGGDSQSSQLWWWENPGPGAGESSGWRRHAIKRRGEKQHHDQAFGDFLGQGRPQLAFWNQRAKSLYLAEIPARVRSAGPWEFFPVLSGARAGSTPYTEGMSAFDVDVDGKVDILAYNMWFKHLGRRDFKAIKVADGGGLIFAGYFKPTKLPQIVISPGDGVGRVRWYECTGNPEVPADWKGHDLCERDVVHGHSLQLGDIDRDGNLDIFVAEMAKWHDKKSEPDHPGATAFVFFGDGNGHFRKTELVKGHGWHEARLADLDGDGDLDILNKPYTWETPRVDVWLRGGSRRGARGVGTSESFPGPVGLQLYSLRDTFKTNVPLGLQYARNFGFVEVELAGTYGIDAGVFRSMLATHGLRPIATHFGFDQWENDPEAAVREAKALGVEYAGCAWIPHEGPFGEKTCRRAISVFNRAGKVAAQRGVKFFYHNHGYEFVPRGDGTLFDLLVEETDPALVHFEMDVFWVVHPGQDPVELLRKYPDRWKLLHIKDLRKGVATGKLTGQEDVRNDVALGTGQIDLRAALCEAVRVGVEHYFIEDESPSVVEQIPQSLRHLESLAW